MTRFTKICRKVMPPQKTFLTRPRPHEESPKNAQGIFPLNRAPSHRVGLPSEKIPKEL